MEPSKPAVLFAGKYLRVLKEGRWEFADRTASAGAVAIAAVSASGHFLLIEQFRPPVSATVIELPAGLAGDEPGTESEDFADAARRELLEETGYGEGSWKQAAWGPPSAGLASELVAIYIARGVKRLQSGGGVGHEKIRLHEIPLSHAKQWLQEQHQKGQLIDPKVFAGLYFLTP